MTKPVLIAIPVLLVVLRFIGLGGKGFAILAFLLLLVGGYLILRQSRRRHWWLAMAYVVGLEAVFFLFS